MRYRLAMVVLGLAVVALVVLFGAGSAWMVESPDVGAPTGGPIADEALEARARALGQTAASLGGDAGEQILFGDLHVHTTYSFDAFQMSLPMAGGDGTRPVADACDYARHCAGLDFWSINDHGITLTPTRWSQTVEAIRQCNEIAGDEASPDLVSYLGWEGTQVGTKPENHWGHKNVIFEGLADDQIPTRPITAGVPEGVSLARTQGLVATLGLGALALMKPSTGGPEFARYMQDTNGVLDCPTGVPVRELPTDCREVAPTPAELFAKLDDWGVESMVIPHGTAWGFYTPLGSSWQKQLRGGQHDPKRQLLVELYSGHGNSEEYRDWKEVILHADGSKSCPEPVPNYLPSCWRAGEIIMERCHADGSDHATCAKRAVDARQHYVEAFFNGGARTVPGATAADWQDAGQCRDCFLPDFNYRPASTVQYMMALGEPQPEGDTAHFRFGFMAASDNHSARPGTGYKQVARTAFTEAHFGNFLNTPVGQVPQEEPVPESRAIRELKGTAPFALFETERQASFFMTGGLAAVHAKGRDRKSIWEALASRAVYGTSGPRILLWFDLLNPPGGETLPMGSEVAMAETPRFRVRAAGSFEQHPGCPPDAASAMPAGRIEDLCRGECYHPSDERRKIVRVEIVRILPQVSGDEPIASRIEDPWKVLSCPAEGDGCIVEFEDPEFVGAGADALYYARAIEESMPTVGANPLGCTRDANGRCSEIDLCFWKADSDDCLAPAEHRAWSSPIFVDYERS
ncbi:MAG: DUF3604 domain-containing protein [Myxococcota bacterium]